MRRPHQKTKGAGKRMLKYWLRRLKEARESATLKNAKFSEIYASKPGYPTRENEVTDFIRDRTNLYRQSWIISPLDEIIGEIEETLERQN